MDGTRPTFVSFRTDPNQEKQERLLNSSEFLVDFSMTNETALYLNKQNVKD